MRDCLRRRDLEAASAGKSAHNPRMLLVPGASATEIDPANYNGERSESGDEGGEKDHFAGGHGSLLLLTKEP